MNINKAKGYISLGFAAIIVFGIFVKITGILFTLGAFSLIGILIVLIIYGVNKIT